MSRVCACCHKKISRGEKRLDLVYEHEALCENCCGEAKRLLMPIKILADKRKIKEVRKKFKAELEASTYPYEVKELLKREFDEMFWADFFLEKNPVRRIEVGFDQVYNKVVEIMKRYKMEPGEPFVAECGEIKIAKMSHSEFYENGRGYFITLVIVGDDDRSIVSSSADESLYEDANEKNRIFWKYLSQSFGDVEFEEIAERPYTLSGPRTDGGRETKKRVGILGGTFDPVHLGHAALAKAAIDEAELNKLIVMPAKVQPFKQGKRVTEDEHRIEMVRLSFADEPKAEVSDYEIENTIISYTYDTLAFVQKQYPEDKLFFIMGADSFMEADMWYKGQNLLRKFGIIVSLRPGFDEAELDRKTKEFKALYGTEIIKLKAPMPEISSTEIRKRFAGEMPVDGLIQPEVERYIKKNGLYKQDTQLY